MTVYENLTGALGCGDRAFGMAHERPGVGLTRTDDRLLALGYPHMLVPVDEPVPWQKMQTMADVFKAYPLLDGDWPRELFLWLLARWDIACMPHLWGKNPAQTDDPPTHDIDALIAGPHKVGDRDILLYALEAVHGSIAVAERAVALVESWSDEDFGHKTGHMSLVRGLHFVLLRVDRDERASLVDRLEAVFARVQETCRYPNGVFRETVRGLDVALHGRAGVERSGYRPDRVELGTSDLALAWDDTAWIAEIALARVPEYAPRDRPAIDARLAFLGGEPVVQALCDNVAGFHSSQRKRIVMQMGRFAHPAVRRAMETLAGLSGAKKEAKTWLTVHG